MSGILTLIAVAKAKRGGGGITPTGTKEISIAENGTTTHDVTEYASAEITVAVPVPTGTKQIGITENGTTTHDVADYANAEVTVNVPSTGDDYLKWYTSSADEHFVSSRPVPIDYLRFSQKFRAIKLTLLNSTGGANQYAGQYFCLSTYVQVVVLPKVTRPGTDSFLNATALEKVDLGAAIIIDLTAFKGCTAFNTLILRNSSVVTLSNVNAFQSTKFASGGAGGTLYVPQSLKASYEAASNWSTILGYTNNSIEAIEGSIYENAYADGTPIPTT